MLTKNWDGQANPAQNQNDQKLAGHHGVPLLVYENQVFFGQDRFDDFKKVLVKNGLLAG